MTDARVNLLDLTRPELEAWCVERGGKAFRARQLFQWIYKRAETDFGAMTDLAKEFRAQLSGSAEIRLPEIVTRQDAADGTVKWMLRADNAQGFEMVYIPETDRSTLCISSQVGCAMDCSFCSTAQQGFNRNLSTAEIVGQVLLAQRELGFKAGDNRIISNVVLMGMGEPLANFRNVVPAMRILLDELGLDFSRRRLTLSTSGLVPQIYKLAEETNVALAVSLHAPDDELRSELVPVNTRWSVDEALDSAHRYFEVTGRRVSIEYALIRDINDHAWRADLLGEKLNARGRGWVHCNPIPLNPTPGSKWTASDPRVEQEFVARLRAHGIPTTIRDTRGSEIDGACGQLAAEEDE